MVSLLVTGFLFINHSHKGPYRILGIELLAQSGMFFYSIFYWIHCKQPLTPVNNFLQQRYNSAVWFSQEDYIASYVNKFVMTQIIVQIIDAFIVYNVLNMVRKPFQSQTKRMVVFYIFIYVSFILVIMPSGSIRFGSTEKEFRLHSYKFLVLLFSSLLLFKSIMMMILAKRLWTNSCQF